MQRNLKTGVLLASAFIAIAVTGSVLFAPDGYDHYNYDGENDVGTKVAVGRDGSIYVAGTGTDDNYPSADDSDFILVKYNFALDFQWSKFYDGPAHGDDVLTGLAIDQATGNVFISGTSPGADGLDVAIKGFEPDGDELWSGAGFHNGAKRYNSDEDQPDIAHDLAIDSGGNLAVCGQTTPSGQLPQALLIVFKPDGDVKSGWPQLYGASGSIECFNAVACSSTGKIVAAGFRPRWG